MILYNHQTPGKFFDSFCGSAIYSPPEVLSKEYYIGPEVDIWSLGVILYAMVTGCIPWDGDTTSSQVEDAKRGNYSIPHYLSGGNFISIVSSIL